MKSYALQFLGLLQPSQLPLAEWWLWATEVESKPKGHAEFVCCVLTCSILFIYEVFYPPIYSWFIYLSISVCLSVCLSIYLSIYPEHLLICNDTRPIWPLWTRPTLFGRINTNTVLTMYGIEHASTCRIHTVSMNTWTHCADSPSELVQPLGP